jgi:hypothetical protein
MILQKYKEMHLLLHAERPAVLGVCAFTLQLLGWTFVDKASLNVGSLRQLSTSSVTLEDCVTRLTAAEAKTEHA